MKTLKTLEPLTRRLLEIQRVNSAASVLSWDQETYMPAGGGAARAEQIATLQGIAHQNWFPSRQSGCSAAGSTCTPVSPSNRMASCGTNRPAPCCAKCGEITAVPKNYRQILSCS
ncbi:MAG TPA: hypothetical protein VFQ06_05065 [Nitrospira sp.]|nr:hypothetical protein [Nitrospira sp.]